MGKCDDTEERPDPSRYYRPVAIRSVVAAQAMIKRPVETSVPEPEMTGLFSLPEGFHAPIED